MIKFQPNQVVFKESPAWISPMYFFLYICPVILPAVILVSCCAAVTFKLLLANKIIGRKIQLNEIPRDSSTLKRNTVLRKKRMEKQVGYWFGFRNILRAFKLGSLILDDYHRCGFSGDRHDS